MIDTKAVVDPAARLGSNVEVGPYSIIGPDVEIGDGTRIGAHVVIKGPTRIGRDNKIYQFASIGDDPQDKKYAGEPTRLEIGDRNLIREYCTINRGTMQDKGVTRVGDDNWIMAYVHIAHDCQLGNDITLANNTALAGHVTIDDHAILGGFTLIHQFCAIGAFSFSALGTVILKDIPPFVMISGNPARPHGLNTEGLKRRGFPPESMRAIRQAYKIIYRSGNTMDQACEKLAPLADEYPDVAMMVQFLTRVTRGIAR